MSKKIDYLKEDPELAGQKYACVSIITPETVKGSEKMDVRAFKIRGVYNSYDSAVERAKELQKSDPLHNVYVADVGKWLPLCDDPEKAKEENYANETLNKIMKNDRDNKEKAKVFHEQRKTMMVQEARLKADKKKKKKKKRKNKLKEEEDKNELVIEDVKLEDKKLKEEEEKIKEDIEELNEEEKLMNVKKENLGKLTTELEKARKVYEDLKKEEKNELKVVNA
jgi:hypothetical protein